MKLRVSAVQFPLAPLDSFADFARQVEHHVRVAEQFGAEFVLFPEFLTTPLLTLGPQGQHPIAELAAFTETYRELFRGLARTTGMHLIGGTQIIREGDRLLNAAHLFYPDGQIAIQPKLHLTPPEVSNWHLSPGESLRVFPTSKGPIAILTCYDVEFPEIVRMARAKGANVLFCPSSTSDRHGFHRVRHCCHARAIENQIYVAVTGTVGALPDVAFMRATYGQAAIISPNDLPFPPGGLLAEGEVNQAMVITADLDLDLLEQVRERGAVTTWRDRRTDLYPDWT